jgi:hypothetical protein
MTHNKYSTQANNKYNDMFINKFENPSNIIQKRLQKATTVTNNGRYDPSGNKQNDTWNALSDDQKQAYIGFVNQYKQLGVKKIPSLSEVDVSTPDFLTTYAPQKALEAQNQELAGQKRDKIWGSLTPAQQYAYTTLAGSAKSLGMDVPAIESVDLSNPFWLAKTLNDVNEKISYTNFKGAFDANKAYAFDQFKQEKMYYDDSTRMYDADTWQKMWNDSAQSKLWSDDSFNSQWNTKLTIDRMGNGLWDLGQWGNKGRGGGGGGGPEGGGPVTPPPETPPNQFTAADLDTYLRENNIQFSSDPESEYQKTVRDFWTAYGPGMGRTNVRKPSYITAQGNRNPIDFTQNNQTVTNSSGPAKLTQEQQAYVDGYANELKNQYGENSDEYKTFLLTPPIKQLKAGIDDGYKGGLVSLGAPYVPSKDTQGNVYGSSAYTNQAFLDWQNKQRAKFPTGLTSQGINPPAVPSFKTITEAIAAGMKPQDAAGAFGIYPSNGISGRNGLDLNEPSGLKYDLIPTITPIPVKSATPFPVTTITPQPTSGSGGGIKLITNDGITPQPTPGAGGGIRPITNDGTTIQPTLGSGGGIKPITTRTTKRMEGSFRMSNTKKFMGGKTGRMGPLINDGVGEKGRYFEKGNARKSQSKNAIKFYETDKTDNVPMSKSFMKALARKIHEINDAKYFEKVI